MPEDSENHLHYFQILTTFANRFFRTCLKISLTQKDFQVLNEIWIGSFAS
jgi:hypothetical protein